MPPEHEIDYEALIDRTITDFRPVKRLWRICTRLFFWTLMESAILAMTGAFLGYNFLSVGVDRASLLLGSGVSIVASVAAAVLALRAAIPGNEISLRELVALIALICLAVLIPSDHRSGLANQWNDATDLFGLAALPWFALFWAVRRGVPLQPVKTGAIVGLSAFSFALAILRLIHYQDGVPNQTIWLFACGFVLAAFSAVAGRLWLDWVDRWRRSSVADEARQSWFASRVVLPAAVAASITGFTLVVWNTSTHAVVIPDFDLTIYSYQRSLTGFRPNVPSASIESVLADYVEHGMPAYMWDFGPEGFRLVGGRWQPLTDGPPVTYTWFHGRTGGVICMMRQTEAFNPPPGRAKYIKVSSFTDIAASVFA